MKKIFTLLLMGSSLVVFARGSTLSFWLTVKAHNNDSCIRSLVVLKEKADRELLQKIPSLEYMPFQGCNSKNTGSIEYRGNAEEVKNFLYQGL
jgi:hypothetical protein